MLLAWACVTAAAAQAAEPPAEASPAKRQTTVSFDSDSPGLVSTPWRLEGTNQAGPVAKWEVTAAQDAPSPPNVLALSDPREGASATFNLCWTDKLTFDNGRIEVKCKSVAGKEDQGGGPMWRAQNANNYYICRVNPLEGNFRVYCVKDGARKMLDGTKVDSPVGQWHTIAIEQHGQRIRCFLNGQKLLDARDSTFPTAGGVGVWTKADAVTWFDDLVITPDTGDSPTGDAPEAAAQPAASTPDAPLHTLLPRAALTLADAIARAERHVGGVGVAASYRATGETLTITVTVLVGSTPREVEYDATTGALLSE